METLQQIAWKVSTIEQKVAVVAQKAPEPKAATVTSSYLPGSQKATTAKVTTWNTVVAEKNKVLTDILWYKVELCNISTEQLIFWAAMISTGKWGPTNLDRNTIGFSYRNADPKSHREDTTTYIRNTINTHFTPKSSGQFPSPPLEIVPITSGWVKAFTWIICD